jgi:uncharacterized protein DUF6651
MRSERAAADAAPARQGRIAKATANSPPTMPFKFDSNGAIVTTGEGDKKLPVFIHADGREAPFDGDQTVATITRLNGEAKSHREAKEAAEKKLSGLPQDLIDNAEAAVKALETVKNLSTGELKTAAQVQEIKDAAAKSAQEAVASATRAAAEKERALSETNATLTQQLHSHIIGGSFSGSKFIGEKLAIPADIALKVFGDRFKVDGGKLVALDANGNPLFSAVRHGEHADFEEAIQVMVSQYPHKDMILKGSGAAGGGAAGGGGSGAGGKTTITRTQFQALSPAEQRAKATDKNVEIVDG